MTKTQKAIIRELLELSYAGGFDTSYPLAPIAEKLGVKGVLYDNKTNTGVLWDLGKHGKGYLAVNDEGTHASINFDLRDQLANWCR